MRTTYALVLGSLLVTTAPAPLTISLSVAGKSYKVSGAGSCEYAPMASYYDMRAKMWKVEYNSEEESGLTNLMLTVWRPLAGGADQMSLDVRIGSVAHRIDNVKKSQNAGSGTLKVTPKGEGGTFVIQGKDAKGAAIKGTIECSSFSAQNAVAG